MIYIFYSFLFFKTFRILEENPLDQFLLWSIIPCPFASQIYIFNSNLYVYVVYCIFGCYFFFFFENTFYNNIYKYIFFQLKKFICLLIKVNIKIYIRSFFFIIFFIFLFVLSINIFGMIPDTYALSSQFIITFSLAFILIFGITAQGFILYKDKFCQFLIPNGSPLGMMYFLIFIECVSYIARIFSLSIRLFANIMAGHTLLKILTGFLWFLLLKGGFMFIFGLVPFSLILVITTLEFAIAFLQAYVFIILICIYFTDALYVH